VARRDSPGSSVGQLPDWKRRSERLVGAGGAPYTIVRSGWSDHTAPGDDRLVFDQGDSGNGGIGRGQVAEVLVQSLLSDAAVGRTFALFAAAGAPPTDWDGLFAGLPADRAGVFDGAGDPDTLPAVDVRRYRRTSPPRVPPTPGALGRRDRTCGGWLYPEVESCSGWNWWSSWE
jgi:hypothetical protein